MLMKVVKNTRFNGEKRKCKIDKRKEKLNQAQDQ